MTYEPKTKHGKHNEHWDFKKNNIVLFIFVNSEILLKTYANLAYKNFYIFCIQLNIRWISNLKSKLMIIFPLIIIIGVITISIVLPQPAPNSPQPPAQTPPPPPPAYLTETGLPIPEQFAAEVSAFSEGIQLDVTVNDTTPRVGGAVLVVIRITNVNSSEPVRFLRFGIEISVFNSEGVIVDGVLVWFPTLTITLDYGGFPINQTHTDVWVWKVTPLPNSNVEFKPGESYDIVVSCGFQTRSAHQIKVSSTPIQVVISS